MYNIKCIQHSTLEFVSAHECKFPGCKMVLVLDGNMKNRRHVCNARDAGYIEYDGLPGKVKTGCMLTPEYKSRYCSNHKIRACNFDVVTVSEGTNTSYNLACKYTYPSTE